MEELSLERCPWEEWVYTWSRISGGSSVRHLRDPIEFLSIELREFFTAFPLVRSYKPMWKMKALKENRVLLFRGHENSC